MVECIVVHMSKWNNLFSGELKDRLIRHKKYNTKTDALLAFVYVWEERSFVYARYASVDGKSHFIRTNIDRCNDGDDLRATGGRALASLTKLCKKENPDYDTLIHLHGEDQDCLSASNLLYFNPKYNGTRHYGCIGYDRNSAYPWAMLQDMPDTRRPLGPGIVEKGQVGFNEGAPLGSLMHFEGYAQYRFPLIPTPFTNFVKRWYDEKKTTKNDMDKQRAKNYLVYAVGALQNVNCFLRAAIVEYSSQYMLDIINRYEDIILLSNTDSIIATERIPELDENIGIELGQWKIEHIGNFAYRGPQWQWNYKEEGEESKFAYRGLSKEEDKESEFACRGVSKIWIENIKGWDILTSPMPSGGNHYMLKEDGMICLIEKQTIERN